MIPYTDFSTCTTVRNDKTFNGPTTNTGPFHPNRAARAFPNSCQAQACKAAFGTLWNYLQSLTLKQSAFEAMALAVTATTLHLKIKSHLLVCCCCCGCVLNPPNPRPVPKPVPKPVPVPVAVPKPVPKPKPLF